MTYGWTSGNALQLLENGEEFFPAVFDAIRNAEHRVVLETFILFEDSVGNELQQVLIAAAMRGVQIDVTVDGYGSADLTPEYIDAMTSVGVRFHIYDLQPRLFGIRTNLFRRMHRKIVVVDGVLAFVGGINFSADHLTNYGPTAKQDYAVAIRGPLVADIADFVAEALRPVRPRFSWRPSQNEDKGDFLVEGEARAALVVRDNGRHHDDIERYYRVGIRAARHEVTIANAYFFPGYRFLRDLRRAAQRGVRVRLILQGEPDMPLARFAATMLYDYLLSGGVQIYEYCEKPLHGKVAYVDGIWSTVGSSNLDPLSLALNLEANVMVRDRAFTSDLRSRLETLVDEHCRLMQPLTPPRRKIQRVLVGTLVFHILRRLPSWAERLPTRDPEITSMPLVTEDPGKGET